MCHVTTCVCDTANVLTHISSVCKVSGMTPSRKREIRRSWGQRVSDRREELRLSQAQVHELSGLPQQTISRVELDLVVPRYSTMAALAKGLATTVPELFPVDSYPERLKTSRKSAKATS